MKMRQNMPEILLQKRQNYQKEIPDNNWFLDCVKCMLVELYVALESIKQTGRNAMLKTEFKKGKIMLY